MIISRTPFRISFFGGGTDYPGWFRKHGGTVLATTIDKYCYLTCRYLPPFFEHRYRIVYSQVEQTQSVEEIAHPAVREVLRYLNMGRGVEIHHDGDLPARSGMGSSSAFTVGLLNAIHALQGHIPTNRQLAEQSIEIEQERLQENVGSQDQIAAAFGGMNHITFQPNGDFSVRPVTLTPMRMRELQSHLMLFYTGVKRTASDVAGSYVHDLDNKKQQLRIMKALVEESLNVLTSDHSITDFGELLHEAWMTKRSLSTLVTNAHVDEIYGQAREAGALGGKLTGAGGGGFMLLFVPPDQQDAVKAALNTLIHVPFRFEAEGSRIIYFDPEADYAVVEQNRINQPIQAFRELAA
ncbi:MAG TPA: kinase [Chthonomonadaceae bacterium]|nr:kinase [Chthonomonadaceae bacterium]